MPFAGRACIEFKGESTDLNVPALAVIPQPMLALHAKGAQSGIVMDSGYKSTTITPVHKGRVIRDAVCLLKVGGDHLTQYSMRMTNERGYSFSTKAE